LRDRLIINVRAAITELEADYILRTDDRDRRLNRAREILEQLLSRPAEAREIERAQSSRRSAP